jgi:phosphatidylglycerophosphatase A
MWIAVLHWSVPSWKRLAVAFVLFRVFDACKPPPLRRLERTAGGWGIVLDDLGAGVYALALTAALAAAFDLN